MRLECPFPMPELHLYHSRRKAEAAAHRIGFGPGEGPTDADAQTWFADGVAIVLIEADCDWHSAAALLCHEAVHVADAWLEHLGEESPADEERAYMVQAVAEPLFRGHERWLRKHGRGA